MTLAHEGWKRKWRGLSAACWTERWKKMNIARKKVAKEEKSEVVCDQMHKGKEDAW